MPARIPDTFIDELLARVDIVEVIDARVPLRKAGKDFKACCPFHEEKTPSFTVSANKQFYHCFGCGKHGTALGFLMDYEHMSFPEAVADLAARVGLAIPEEPGYARPKTDAAVDLGAYLEQANRYYQRQLREHAQAKTAVEYLKSRGLSGEIAAEYELGFAPDQWHNLEAIANDSAAREALFLAGLLIKKEDGRYYDRFRGRVLFPIRDYRGRLIGFGGRVLGTGEPKYLNSPETPLFHKGRELYGLHQAREAIRGAQRVLVVEGYMDVLALVQFGLRYSVATLGTATTREHMERLFRFTPEVIFCFDGDRAGREAAARALESALPTLTGPRQVKFLFLPEDEDPDSLVRKEGQEAFHRRLDQALGLREFFFKILEEGLNLNRTEDRARLVERARPLLDKLPEGSLKQSLLQRMSEARLPLGALAAGARRGLARRADRTSTPQPRQPSLVRLAVALLLHESQLAQEAGDTASLAALDAPGMSLLLSLLELLRSYPGLSTGAVLERFRGTPHAGALAKLLSWEHPALNQGLSAEFQGLMRRLRILACEQETERLFAKDRLSGLDEQEKARLKRLLDEKRQLDAVRV